MTTIARLIATVFLASTILPVFGQKCMSAMRRNASLHRNPALIDVVNDINKFTAEWIKDQGGKLNRREVLTIPVVVHVLWRQPAENISGAQIQSQIEVLNRDFRKLNDNLKETPGAFMGLAADVELEFCLATIDPLGNETDGITRTQTQVDNIGEADDWFKDHRGGVAPWDNTKYVNIWVCDIGDDGTLGFASPPGTADPPESDGLVIGHQFFGTIGTASASEFNDLGRTTTHEMGHYFNLEHLWGPDAGGCGEDDFVDDTPLQDIESEECHRFPLFDDCTSSGSGIMFNNFMDYTDDICMTMFTRGQKDRMLAAVNGPRSTLLNSNVCAPTTSARSYAFTQNAFKTFPNPAQNSMVISPMNQVASKQLKAELYSVLGHKELDFLIDGETDLDLSEVPNGIYLLICNDISAAPQKIIIAK
jgi:hypothetical protein